MSTESSIRLWRNLLWEVVEATSLISNLEWTKPLKMSSRDQASLSQAGYGGNMDKLRKKNRPARQRIYEEGEVGKGVLFSEPWMIEKFY